MGKLRFPSAYTVLMAVIVMTAVLTHVLPAGQYQRVFSQGVDKEVVVAGTYRVVEPSPQGFVDVLMAPIAGFYDPDTSEAGAIDVALFVLMIGGFMGVVARSGAIAAGIARVMARMKGSEIWMIPILMSLFAIGGTVCGMAEETLPFYMLLIPVVLGAGFDAMTGVAIVLVGAGIGVLGSTVNPFATVIASQAADVPFTEGLGFRLFILIAALVISTVYVMRYAQKVKKDPSRSLVFEQKESNEAFFLKNGENNSQHSIFTTTHALILTLFFATFAVMIWGVSVGGWWMAEMSALFVFSSIVVGLIARMSEKEFTDTFVDGARELLGVAFVIAIARGVVVIMDAGAITDTVLHWAESAVSDLSQAAFVNAMYWVQIVLSFVIPSSSGLAVLSMPIMAPLADFAGVGRELVVTAYQSASGIVNLITPTSGVVMGALAIGRISYNQWIAFMMPLLGLLTLFLMVAMSTVALMS